MSEKTQRSQDSETTEGPGQGSNGQKGPQRSVPAGKPVPKPGGSSKKPAAPGTSKPKAKPAAKGAAGKPASKSAGDKPVGDDGKSLSETRQRSPRLPPDARPASLSVTDAKPSPKGKGGPRTAADYSGLPKTPAPASSGEPTTRLPAQPAPVAATEKSARKASLRLRSIDPWSVTKVTFALTFALGIVVTVAVSILWVVLGVSGIWDSINSSVGVVLANDDESFDVSQYVGYGRIIGLTLLVSAINVILFTAIATVGAYLYNLAASLLGGLHITLTDD